MTVRPNSARASTAHPTDRSRCSTCAYSCVKTYVSQSSVLPMLSAPVGGIASISMAFHGTTVVDAVRAVVLVDEDDVRAAARDVAAARPSAPRARARRSWRAGRRPRLRRRGSESGSAGSRACGTGGQDRTGLPPPCRRSSGPRALRARRSEAQLSASFLSDASSVSASIGVRRLMSTSRSRETSRSSAGDAARTARAAASAPAGRCR